MYQVSERVKKQFEYTMSIPVCKGSYEIYTGR